MVTANEITIPTHETDKENKYSYLLKSDN